MQVRLTTDRAFLLGVQRCGEVIEVTDAEGQRLLATNQAEPVECMAKAPAENAARNFKPLKRR